MNYYWSRLCITVYLTLNLHPTATWRTPQRATIFTFHGVGWGESKEEDGMGWGGMGWKNNIVFEPTFSPGPRELFVWLLKTFVRPRKRIQTKESASQPNYNRCPAHCSARRAWFQPCVQAFALWVPPVKHVSHPFSFASLQGFPQRARSMSLLEKENVRHKHMDTNVHGDLLLSWQYYM